MQQPVLIGIIAGTIAALLFVTAAAGPTGLRILLFLFCSLPVFVAGLSAGWSGAVIASLVAAFLTSVVLSTPLAGVTFGAMQLVPATILCYFALLHRDELGVAGTEGGLAPTGGFSGRQWYPLGWTLLWATVMAVAVAVAIVVVIAPDFTELKTVLRTQLDTFLDAQLPGGTEKAKTVSVTDRDTMVEVMVYLLPAAFAISSLSTLLLNFWLGGRIARAFGALSRPWPDIAAIAFPAGTPIVFALCLVGAWTLGGTAGLVASACAGGLFFAYTLLGLAIIHHVTRGFDWRIFALVAVYFCLIVFNSAFWIIIVVVGLAEPISPLRRNFDTDPFKPANDDR